MGQKVLPFNIPKPDSSSLIYQVDKEKKFYDKLHQHEELQLSIILEGEGDVIIGDTISRFRPTDVFLIGGNVPHLFKSDHDSKRSHMLTLFFTEDSFGVGFFDLEELIAVKKILDKMQGGYRLKSTYKQVKELFLKVEKEKSLGRFILFLEILKLMVSARKEHFGSAVSRKISEDQGERISKVMSLVMNEFHRDIELAEVASSANMTNNAFCRFFKLRTNKTFVQFLNEVRLEHACNLLKKERDISVAEIAALSGFNNISNFNRKFKDYKKMTPTNFRSTF